MKTYLIYRKVLKNSQEKGVLEGIAVPLAKFYALEQDPVNRRHLLSILAKIKMEAVEISEEGEGSERDHRNSRYLVVDREKCVATCIDDILDGAKKGAEIGAAIGIAGGVQTAGAGAAGGAIIGASLGGVKCSVKPECQDEPKKRIATSIPDRVRIVLSQEGLLRKKMDILVNSGRPYARGQ